MDLDSSCVAGAATIPDPEATLTVTGFDNVRARAAVQGREFIREWAPGSRPENHAAPASIETIRPYRPGRPPTHTTGHRSPR